MGKPRLLVFEFPQPIEDPANPDMKQIASYFNF